MRPSIIFSLLLAIAACTPAHRPADGDGGIGPDSGRPTICGDLFVNIDVGEECDDGNTDDGDGCDKGCKFEIPDGCGDNVLDDGEECDDNNNEAGDGCGPGCWIEGCGNNYLDPGEACEDNNTVDGDGCSADCRSNETCGNGIKDPLEGCDDGDADNGDGCPQSCEPAECGDGFLHIGVESCDDGNDVADDGCTECILDSCGDGNDDVGEECDLGAGNGMNGTTCFKNCISTEISTDTITTAELDPHGSIGSGPQYVEAADFNGDDKADLLIADNFAGTTQVAYGLGDGRIWPAIHNFSNSGSIRSIALEDVNGDGNIDLLATTSGDTLMVMLGNGTGFDVPTVFTTILDIGGDDPFDLVIAELTGDSNLDVATSNNTSNDVVIMAGDGAGGFTATTRLAVSVGEDGVNPRSLAAGDVTGDGQIDIITGNFSSDDVTLFTGLGNGAYSGGQIFTTRVGAGGQRPIDIAVTDVTNDGVADVTVACNTSDDVVVLAAIGGSLAAPQTFTTLDGSGGGDSPQRLFIADVTQDGVKDVVTVNSGSSDVAILAGLGPGVAFGAPTTLSTFLPDESATSSRDVRVADTNGDSIPDIITANASTRDATVLLGEGDGAFAAPTAFRMQTDFDTGGPSFLAMGDVNDDGDIDIVTANSSAATVMAGLGDGRFAASQIHSSFSAQNAAAADFNGDGLMDYAAPESLQISVFMQQRNGGFQALSSSSLSTTPTDVAVGEFTGDGNVDVATVSSSSMFFLENDGTGQLSIGQQTSIGSSVNHCALADVTGDQALDIVMPSTSPVNGVFIGSGTGTGSFAAPVSVETSSGSSGLTPVYTVAADLNGDGLQDIVTANRSSNDLSVLIGEGSGTFKPPLHVPTVFGADPANVESVAVGDFNNDGFPDLAAVNPARDTISLMLGFGDGKFAAPQTFAVLGRPFSLTVADFDGDGIDDVAVVSIDAGTATTLTGFSHP